MERSRLERLAPLTGVLFFILVLAAFLVFPDETPDAGDGRAKVVKFWMDHDSDAMVSSVLWALSTIPLLWFAGALRSASRLAEGGTGRLSATAFAGAIALAAGNMIGANLTFVVGDVADDVPPAVTQTLSALSSDFFFPFILGGAVGLLPPALGLLRHRLLHPAFRWIANAIAAASITPVGFFGFLAPILWVPAAAVDPAR